MAHCLTRGRQDRATSTIQRQAAGMEGAQGGPVPHAHTRDPCCCRCPHAVLLQGAVHGAGALIQQREHGALVQQAGETQTLLLPSAVSQAQAETRADPMTTSPGQLQEV